MDPISDFIRNLEKELKKRVKGKSRVRFQPMVTGGRAGEADKQQLHIYFREDLDHLRNHDNLAVEYLATEAVLLVTHSCTRVHTRSLDLADPNFLEVLAQIITDIRKEKL